MRVVAQGEITVIWLGPVRSTKKKVSGYSPLPMENGTYVIGHSETGHHHVLSRPDAASVMVLDRPPEGMRVLRAILDQPMQLKHERGFDTHEPLELVPGEYEFRIAREYDPYEELARRSMD